MTDVHRNLIELPCGDLVGHVDVRHEGRRLQLLARIDAETLGMTWLTTPRTTIRIEGVEYGVLRAHTNGSRVAGRSPVNSEGALTVYFELSNDAEAVLLLTPEPGR